MLPSETEDVQGYVRMAVSDNQRGMALVHFIQSFKWEQAVLVHSRDKFGSGMAEALQSHASALGVRLVSYSVPASPTRQALADVAAQVGSERSRVVLLALTQQPLLEFLLEFDTQGLDVTQRVWLSGWPYLECVAEAVELLPPERQADGFRVLHGLVAAREWETDNLTEWQDEPRDPELEMELLLLQRGISTTGNSGAVQVRSSSFISNSMEKMYNSVWTMAFGLAAATRANATARPSAATFTAQLLAGGEGAQEQGEWLGQWDAQGNIKSSRITIGIFNYQSPLDGTAGSAGPGVVKRVASWNLQSRPSETAGLQWPDGSAYPQVPSAQLADAKPPPSVSTALVAATSVLAVLLLLAALLPAIMWVRARQGGRKPRKSALKSGMASDGGTSSRRVQILEQSSPSSSDCGQVSAGDAQNLSVSSSAPSESEIMKFLGRFDSDAVRSQDGAARNGLVNKSFLQNLSILQEEKVRSVGRRASDDRSSARTELDQHRHKDAMGSDVVQYLIGICDPDDRVAQRASVDLTSAPALDCRSLDIPTPEIGQAICCDLELEDIAEGVESMSALPVSALEEGDAEERNAHAARKISPVMQSHPDLFAESSTSRPPAAPHGSAAAAVLPGAVPSGGRHNLCQGAGARQGSLEHSGITVPPRLAHRLAREFDLDMVTAQSPLNECQSPLAVIMQQCVELFDLRSHLLISRKNVNRLTAFATRLEAGYEDGGYHCKRHAADVTNRFAAILHRTDFASNLSAYDTLAALVAAALHDYKHPQVTNQYLILQEHEIAEAFVDQSPAEMYSLRCALSMMRHEEGLNFLEDVWQKNGALYRQKFRFQVAEIVLGTDMKKHFQVLKHFRHDVLQNERLAGMAGASSGELWSAMDDPQRMLSLQVALKVADIGHCALPLDQHTEWLQKLENEMFKQGDSERHVGLPVSPLMDRRRSGVTSAKSQVGFFDVIVLPLLTDFVSMFPECKPLLDQASANRKYWARVSKLERPSTDARPSTTVSMRAIPSSLVSASGDDRDMDGTASDGASDGAMTAPRLGDPKGRKNMAFRSMSMAPTRSALPELGSSGSWERRGTWSAVPPGAARLPAKRDT
eukprot:jgi/Tetstr1/454398/TSEL_004029.t2